MSLSELAAVVQTAIGDAKLHLHNKPSGLLNFTSDSYLAIGGRQVPIPIVPRSFDLLGSTYTYSK
jgi:hypothetical protein